MLAEGNAMERVQFITHRNERFSWIDSARIALEGGCKWVQLRMKGVDKGLVEETAVKVKGLCLRYGALFIINDHVDICRHIKADGVHLGKGDMPVSEARSLLGNDYIIGATANTFDDVCQAVKSQADYIGCGPYRFTSTKERLSPTLGLDGYRDILHNMRIHNIRIPLYAIGGLTSDDVVPLLTNGIHGIALSSYILNAPDPVETMRQIILTTNNALLP